MKKLFILLLIIISLLLLSCNNKDLEKSNITLKKNDELNHAFSSKNWKMIHAFEEKAYLNGVGLKPIEINEFVKKYERGFHLDSLTLQTVSYRFSGDTIETKNLKRMILIPNPKKIFDDTVYHYWVIIGDEFLLKDWDVHKYESNQILGDSLLKQKLDKIRDSLHLKLENE